MSFLSYWDIFGVVLIVLYLILSWLYPERTRQRPKAKAEKEEYSRTQEKEDLKAVRDTDGLSSEPFIHSQSDIPEFVWNTSRSSLNGDARAEFTIQEVNTTSCKIDSSSVENKEKIRSSSLDSDLSLPSFESTITSKGLFQSMQDSGHASKNSSNDELPSDNSSKFSESILSSEDISLSLAEIPETENKEQVSSVVELGGDGKDLSKPVEYEEDPSNSYMECNRNARDGANGLPSIDVGKATSVVSDFNDNLNRSLGETTASIEIQTSEITSCNAEEISREVLAEAMDAIDLQSSPAEPQEEHFQKFANDLASTTIETAVDNSISLNTFAESLSEKIFSDSADDVILEVQTSLAKQKIDAKIKKELEMEELESLGTCVASEVVNEAVGEAALKKEYMDDDELDVTSVQEIQPHIGFVVENVVNTAICEAASKLQRGDIEEPTSPVTEEETPGLYDKSNEIETNNNIEAVSESVILPVEVPLKDEADEVAAEESCKLEIEVPFDVNKPLIEDLSVKNVSEQADKPVEDQSEKLIVTDDEQKVDVQKIDKQVEQVEQEFEENLSEPFPISFPISLNGSAETENDRGTAENDKTDEKFPVEDISTSKLTVAEIKDEITISNSSEAKHEPKYKQITAEDGITDEKTPVVDILASHELIDFERKVETISDSTETKDKPELVTAEDAITDEKTPVEGIPTSHELINFERKDETISYSCEAKDEQKDNQLTTEDAVTEQKSPVEDIHTSHVNSNKKNETTILDSVEAKVEPQNDQVTAEDAITDDKTPVDIPTSHEFIDSARKDETISDSKETKDKLECEQNISPTVNLDNNFEISKEKLVDPTDKEEDTTPVIPEIKLTLDKDKSDETDGETSPPSSPEIVTQKNVTLRNKDQQNSENREGFWRRSLILDLEEDLEFEDSISSESYDVTSPDLSKERKEVAQHSEDSGDFTDSEEDEIIDHDAEARLGAVGGSSKQVTDEPQDDEFDWYDYEQDFDDEDDAFKNFEPVFTVDGLCVSRQQEKEKPKLRSVGSHYNRAVVLDNGSGIIKVGYAGDRVPRVVQQNVTGMPQRFSMHITGMESNLRDYKKYGSGAVAKAGVMHLTHPMKAGLIENWTDIEEIWEYLLYEELGAEIGDNPVLITEVSQNPRKNREKIAEILFEHLNVPAMFLADQLPLSLYASGMTSGFCLSSGFSCTQAGVVYEGHTLAYTQQQLDIGGGDLTENLKILLRDIRARNFTTSSGWQIVNDIKETMGFVAKDYDHDIDKYQKNDSLTQYYKLPDGQMVDIGYECMSCVEPLFQPNTLMSANTTTASQQPVHKLIDTAIKRCNPDLQDLCYKHIVLSGGTTLLKGFTSRLQHELHHINHRVRKIRSPEHRRHSPWIGGSILASLSSFEEQYVTVDDYSESGSQIIQRKCF